MTQQDKINQCDQNILKLQHAKKHTRKDMRRVSKWSHDRTRIVNAVNKNVLLTMDDISW